MKLTHYVPDDEDVAAATTETAQTLPANSEEALALSFVSWHGHDLRYVDLWSKWLRYDGKRWHEDNTLAVYDLSRALCRDAANQCNKLNNAHTVASAKTVAAVEKLARADRRVAAITNQWDADIWLVNTPDGIVDLQSGLLRAHDPNHYMTKMTAVGPRGECPLWLTFLNRITAGDDALQGFLQRCCGYMLTGSTREHALGFGYGTGANGKSVFTSTITGIMADYAASAPIETFTVTGTEQHPTELARLRGARLVVSTETEEGRRWAESKIKMLTGGDKVAARFMRQDFFEYVPQFKLWIIGNHKPGLRSVNEAIRRRFLLVPFAVTIPPDERDNDLADKLKMEWPGIMAWMVAGAMEWQKIGLAPPPTVADATNQYLESEDAVSLWLDECTVADKDAWESNSVLFASWKTWTEQTGEYTGTQRRFLQNLETKGLIWERHKHARGYRGRRITAVQWNTG